MKTKQSHQKYFKTIVSYENKEEYKIHFLTSLVLRKTTQKWVLLKGSSQFTK